jgi:hypothetical protein
MERRVKRLKHLLKRPKRSSAHEWSFACGKNPQAKLQHGFTLPAGLRMM